MTTSHPGSIGAPPRLPTRIGHYKIIERIGRGAMGVVYSARDEEMDRTVALKVMAADLDSEPEVRARFEREANVGGQLLHRNITATYDLGEADGRLYIVMELLRGAPLNQFLTRQEGVPLETRIDLMIQLCEGLSAAHAQGVFHRDIKPSNLYVLNDGSLKILDFGIARLATSTMTVSGFIIGTPDYMSPEQTIGADVDHRSDLFSAGAVFYFILTGRKPFASPDLPAVLRKVQHEDPPVIAPEEAPPALTRILLRALAKRREDRPQSARELAADLVNFRRDWEGEARQVAERARAGYQVIETLTANRLQASRQLGVELDPTPDPVLAALQDEYPLVAEHGAAGFLRIPFRRDIITDILARIDARRAELEAAVGPLRAAAEALVQAEDALRTGAPQQAVPLLESAARSVPQSPILDAALARGREQSARFDETEAKTQELLTTAKAARNARDWIGMLEVAEQLRQLNGGGPKADMLREEAESGIERERFARLHALRNAVDAGMRAVELGRLDEAEDHVVRAEALAEELGSDSAAAPAASLRANLDRARRAMAQVVDSQAQFDAGCRHEAIEALEAFRAKEPDAPGVGDALARLVAESDRLAELERRRAQAATHLAAAEEAWAGANAIATRDEATSAFSLEPTLDRARELVMDARVHLRRAADHQARLSRAQQALADARASLDEGQFSRGATQAEAALLMDETAAEAAALVLEALRRESDQRTQNLRTRTERGGRREVERSLLNARSALRFHNWNRAAEACEAVLAAEALNAEARAIFAQALRRVPASDDAAGSADAQQAQDDSARETDTESTVRGLDVPHEGGFINTVRSSVGALLARVREGRLRSAGTR
ncbi:MAG: serine/threonine-protein kinase [Acidobacteria bacterium]|nr:serine/threonine-protein kinase [Acidobacteriota bacterium]